MAVAVAEYKIFRTQDDLAAGWEAAIAKLFSLGANINEKMQILGGNTPLEYIRKKKLALLIAILEKQQQALPQEVAKLEKLLLQMSRDMAALWAVV